MSKKWKNVSTNALEAFTESTKEERKRKSHKFDNAIKKLYSDKKK